MIATITTTAPRTTRAQGQRIVLDPMALAAVRLVRPQDRMHACWCTVHPAEGGLLVVPK
jgi:hypothetical protein